MHKDVDGHRHVCELEETQLVSIEDARSGTVGREQRLAYEYGDRDTFHDTELLLGPGNLTDWNPGYKSSGPMWYRSVLARVPDSGTSTYHPNAHELSTHGGHDMSLICLSGFWCLV